MSTTKKPAPKGGRPRPLFHPGTVYTTPGAMRTLTGWGIAEALARHFRGDWGDLCDEDKRLNDEALENGLRLFSAYHAELGEKFWVITEAEDDDGVRRSTTVLLPDEY